MVGAPLSVEDYMNLLVPASHYRDALGASPPNMNGEQREKDVLSFIAIFYTIIGFILLGMWWFYLWN